MLLAQVTLHGELVGEGLIYSKVTLENGVFFIGGEIRPEGEVW